MPPEPPRPASAASDESARDDDGVAPPGGGYTLLTGQQPDGLSSDNEDDYNAGAVGSASSEDEDEAAAGVRCDSSEYGSVAEMMAALHTHGPHHVQAEPESAEASVEKEGDRKVEASTEYPLEAQEAERQRRQEEVQLRNHLFSSPASASATSAQATALSAAEADAVRAAMRGVTLQTVPDWVSQVDEQQWRQKLDAMLGRTVKYAEQTKNEKGT